MSDIIPFGKYKGQEIEQVRQRDPQYLQWLTQQAWFAEKFAPVYQIVVNNFAPPSEDTPAHNALQVRFLEFAFRDAFFSVADVVTDQTFEYLRDRFKQNTAELRQAPLPTGHYRLNLKKIRHASEREIWERHLEQSREAVRSRWATWRHVRAAVPQFTIEIGAPKFEGVSDVLFGVDIVAGRHAALPEYLAAVRSYRFAIEIKPSMGDDYPAVLRQMKRQKEAARLGHENAPTHWFLLVDEFGSTTVTLDQVRAIFAGDDIEIVVLADVRERLIALQR